LRNAQNTHSAQQVHYYKAHWGGTYTPNVPCGSVLVVHYECMYHSPFRILYSDL